MVVDSSEFIQAVQETGANELLSHMLEISTVGIIFFDAGGDIIQANDTFLRMTGYSRQDLREGLLRWDRFTPPEWMPASRIAIRQLETQGSTIPYEKEYLRKDGTRFRGLFAAKGISPHRGIELVLDITEQHQTQTLLKESEERFRQLAEFSPTGVFQADLQGNITYTNPQAQKILAMTATELLGRGWMIRVFPEDAPLLLERWLEAVAANRPYETECRVRMPDDELRVVCAHSVMLRAEDGRPFGVMGTIEDITSRKLAEATLRETEKLAAVGRLAASIAHEINNPLESVTNLMYLARGTRDVEEIQQYLALADRELRRVSAISNQTLRFHRQSTQPRNVKLCELLEEVISMHHGRLINAHVTVEEHCPPELTLRCFDGEIRQVLNNLVGNAIDAMHARGGRLILRCRPTVDLATGQKGIALTVADTGPGMQPAVMKKIFDAFYTTKGIGGTGLGLWVSRDIVARHQGKLAVRSSTCEGASGTVFRLFLPFDGV